MTDRRARTDGAKGMQEIVSQANKTVPVPECCKLFDNATPFWELLTKSKATRAWTQADLAMLVNLCNTLADIRVWREQLSFEGPTIGEDEKMKAHPLVNIIDQAEKRARMYSVYLQIHPEATQGKSNKQVKQNQIHADSLADKPDEDGLLARPH